MTDVLMGASLGTAVAHTVAGGHRGRHWSVVPVTSGTSVAVFAGIGIGL